LLFCYSQYITNVATQDIQKIQINGTCAGLEGRVGWGGGGPRAGKVQAAVGAAARTGDRGGDRGVPVRETAMWDSPGSGA
jgi:hypothetical protein